MRIFIHLSSDNLVVNNRLVTVPLPECVPAFQPQAWIQSGCGIILTVSLLPPGALTGKALTYINRQYFSDANGNRGGAPNVAVVLVDGWPTDKVEEASRLARESGINIFFVTIEGPDDNEKQNLVEANFVDKVGCCHRGVPVLR